jgi:hypothetical protein
MRQSILVSLLAVVMFVGPITAISDAPVRAGTLAPGSLPLSPNPSSTVNELRAVSAVSASDAWAVGDYTDDSTGATVTLILHWGGTSWSQVPSPSPSSAENHLYGVSAVSATDAWAVGSYIDDTTAHSDTLILHWDGTSWSELASPNPSSYNFLLSVSANSQTDAWAVGHHEGSTDRFGCRCRTLILHWDGKTWSKLSSPSPNPAGNFLLGVSADSITDAWAVGYDHISQGDTLTLHWDGTSWSKVRSPNPGSDRNLLFGVSGSRPHNVWAVGGFLPLGAPGNKTLILHWDGRRWSKIESPNPSRIDNFLNGVTAYSATHAWAVGDYRKDTTHVYRTLVLHWTGSGWSRVRSPSPSSVKLATNAGYGNILYGVSADSVTDAWAVGHYLDNSSGATETLILHWDGTSWSQT